MVAAQQFHHERALSVSHFNRWLRALKEVFSHVLRGRPDNLMQFDLYTKPDQCYNWLYLLCL